MNYKVRLEAEPLSLQHLGRAIYNFTFLEWVVISLIAKLNPIECEGFSCGKHPLEIATAFTKAVTVASPQPPRKLRIRLLRFDQYFRVCITKRTRLVQVNQFNAPDGLEELNDCAFEQYIRHLQAAAKSFEKVAMFGSAILHDGLNRETTTMSTDTPRRLTLNPSSGRQTCDPSRTSPIVI